MPTFDTPEPITATIDIAPATSGSAPPTAASRDVECARATRREDEDVGRRATRVEYRTGSCWSGGRSRAG